MALSNTAVPKYYGMFRDAVIRGEIPVNKEISMEMNRIDDLIANPGVYYDDRAVAVSYTHLDVYKRQEQSCMRSLRNAFDWDRNYPNHKKHSTCM